MIIAAVHRCYKNDQDQLAVIAERVGDILRRYCNDNGYPFVGREKTPASISEKVESGRFSCWSKIDDLYACTIVIPTLRQEASVLKFLRERFLERATKARGSTMKSPDVFRFDATRFIGSLRPPPGVDASERLYVIQFEVQIRTAFEHAWSAATHELVYKSGTVDWKRMRMAAQLKAAVEQLDTLVLAFESSAELITEHPSPDIAAKVAVVAKFQSLLNQGVIPSDSEPKDWSRFADNFAALVRAGSRGARQALPARTDAALDIVAGEMRKLGKSFPRSISLFQLVLGLLTEADFLQLPLQDYSAVVTSELTDLYPRAKLIPSPFDFAH